MTNLELPNIKHRNVTKFKASSSGISSISSFPLLSWIWREFHCRALFSNKNRIRRRSTLRIEMLIFVRAQVFLQLFRFPHYRGSHANFYFRLAAKTTKSSSVISAWFWLTNKKFSKPQLFHILLSVLYSHCESRWRSDELGSFVFLSSWVGRLSACWFDS